jgi:hypothetical protein
MDEDGSRFEQGRKPKVEWRDVPFLCHFQGTALILMPYPGLKPWAQSYCPFGAQANQIGL